MKRNIKELINQYDMEMGARCFEIHLSDIDAAFQLAKEEDGGKNMFYNCILCGIKAGEAIGYNAAMNHGSLASHTKAIKELIGRSRAEDRPGLLNITIKDLTKDFRTEKEYTIREAREASGISIEAAAKAVGLPILKYLDIESGTRKPEVAEYVTLLKLFALPSNAVLI